MVNYGHLLQAVNGFEHRHVDSTIALDAALIVVYFLWNFSKFDCEIEEICFIQNDDNLAFFLIFHGELWLPFRAVIPKRF